MLVVYLTSIYNDPWGNVPKSRTLNTYKNATKIVFFYVLIFQFNMGNSEKKHCENIVVTFLFGC